eukprot:11216046-Lingulodinium_polyedra.AAC.1
MLTWSTVPGHRHSFIGPGQQIVFYPLPLEKPSVDFIEGSGREVKVLGRRKRLPTAPALARAQRNLNNMAIVQAAPGKW